MVKTAQRRGLIVVAGVVLGLLVVDGTRSPERQFGVALTQTGLHAYRRFVSPVLSFSGARCRFTPTCSRYAEAVVATHGWPSGSWLALGRLARCGPWTPAGTVDPPPVHDH
jgi:putative membrane protein insertion efficiency factor